MSTKSDYDNLLHAFLRAQELLADPERETAELRAHIVYLNEERDAIKKSYDWVVANSVIKGSTKPEES